MYGKKAFITVVVLGMLAGVPVALASDNASAPSARQTDLDREYARSHPTTVPGTPAGVSTPGSAYGFVPPKRPSHPAASTKTTGSVHSKAGRQAYDYVLTPSKEPANVRVQDQFYRDSLGD